MKPGYETVKLVNKPELSAEEHDEHLTESGFVIIDMPGGCSQQEGG